MAKSVLFLSIILSLISSVTKAQSQLNKDSIEWAALKDTTEYYVNNFDDRFDTALTYAKLTVKKSLQVFGDKSKNYGLSLNDLAVVYFHEQKYPAAEGISKSAVAIIRNSSGEDDPDYAASLNVYAVIQEKLGKYSEVEQAYNESLKTRENLFLKNSTDYGFDYLESLNNLGNYYCQIEKFDLAEKFLKQAVDLEMQSSGKDSEYAILVNNLANVYMSIGNYSKAEPLFKEALSILDSTSGKGFDYGNTLNNLATLYTSMNNYPAAIAARNEVLAIILKVHHQKTVDYATTSTRLAKLYIQTGNFDSAISLLQSADTIYQRELNTSNLLYAETLDRLGSLYFHENDLANAETYYQRAKQIKEKSLGKTNPSYAESLNSLGLLAFKKENYSDAKNYLDSASSIRLSQLGEEHPDYSESINNILSIYYSKSDESGWDKNISYSIKTWQNSVMHLLLSFDETQKEDYLDNHLQQKDIFLSMLYYFQQHQNTDSLSSVYYKMITALQGWLLSGSQQLKLMITQKNDRRLLNLYSNWILIKKQYTRAIQLNAEKQKEYHLNPAALLSQSEQMEMELIDSLSTYKENLKNAGTIPSIVSKKLNPDEAFVTWVSFRYKAPERWTDSTLYGAFIVMPKDTVAHFIVLFEQNSLKKLLNHYYNSTGRGIVKSNSSSINKNVDQALYQLIWQPLLKYIYNAKKIYIIPSGILNKVSLYALVDTSKKTLLETTELHLLTNINDFFKPSLNKKTSSPSITLFGGANFNRKSSMMSEKTGNDVFPYLQGTQEEVQSLSVKFVHKGWHVQLDTGYAASEENFKRSSGEKAPFILHIATHGFYKSNNSSDTNSEFPLLRSGFVLSGANLFWETDTTAAQGTDDGIVTAQEVSNLDFTKTDLVTLSACETALGEINNNEGVYGLQRAFKIAGVKDLLITLWQIPDLQTKELMNIFYAQILKGADYYEALKKAQIQMKAKYRDPAVWAGFELVGE